MAALQVQGGWLNGHFIRKARKVYRCQYWRGSNSGGTCRKVILPGALYVEGELSDYSGNPWACDKYCPTCAGVEAVATIALVGC